MRRPFPSVCGIQLHCTYKMSSLKDVFFLLLAPKGVTCGEHMTGEL